MKKKFIWTLLSVPLFLAGQAHALTIEQDLSAEVTTCHHYNLWIGFCDGRECVYPSRESAALELAREAGDRADPTKHPQHFVCGRISEISYTQSQEFSGGGPRICLTTKATARFSCQAAW